MSNKEILRNQIKIMDTENIIFRMKELKRMREKLDEEYLELGLELWQRMPSVQDVQKKKRK